MYRSGSGQSCDAVVEALAAVSARRQVQSLYRLIRKDPECPMLSSNAEHQSGVLHLLEAGGPPFSIRGGYQLPPDRTPCPARALSIRRSFRHFTVNCAQRKQCEVRLWVDQRQSGG